LSEFSHKTPTASIHCLSQKRVTTVHIEKLNEIFSMALVLLSVQRALLGVVTPELRAVVVDLDDARQVLYIRFYYHGEVSEDLIELWNCAITEVDLGPDYFFDEGIERLDYPNKIPFRGRYAYLRKE
jgi:hypothetical protein